MTTRNASYLCIQALAFLFQFVILCGIFTAAAAAQASKALAAGDKVPVVLNNNDAIYAEIRDLSIERLGAYLQEKAIHIRERCGTVAI